MSDYCPRCGNKGTVIGFRGNVEPCPDNCPPSQTVRRQMADWNSVEDALGLKPAGHSQVEHRRSATSRSEDCGIKEQT